MTKPGSRVFAVLSANNEEVRFLGFGTYVGDHPRPGTPEQFSDDEHDWVEATIRHQDENPPFDPADMIRLEIEQGVTPEEDFDKRMEEYRESRRRETSRPMRERTHDLLMRLANNPKIELDNGDVVWGYQCWWGPIERWDEVSNGRTIIEVRVPDAS